MLLDLIIISIWCDFHSVWFQNTKLNAIFSNLFAEIR